MAERRATVAWAGLVASPVLALLTYVWLPDTYTDPHGALIEFSHAGRATAALAVWMAGWWMTEAIPVYATALLPLAAFPLFGVFPIKQAAAPYGHELIYLFLGGFILALALQRWGLHRRVAFLALRAAGTRQRHVVAAFMGVTAGLSMWVSNTATTVAILPIALSVIELARANESRSEPVAALEGEPRRFALCLLLGIAYAASIGGIGTLIGTPPNLFLASYARDELGREISFVRWMGVGVPLVITFLPLAWLLLTRVLFPLGERTIEGGDRITQEAYTRLGPMNRGEWITAVVFILTATAWISRPLLVQVEIAGGRPLAGLSDAGIAIGAALMLFVIPVDPKRRIFVMDWETASRLPWGVLILFGGGLSLAAAIKANGLGEWIGSQVSSFADLPSIAPVLVVVVVIIFLTELTSNTATTATLVPILAGIAPGLGLDPVLLIVPAAMAASCAFMLPVATPPNAIVFGAGYLTLSDMSRAGIWLNLIGIALITAITYAVVIPVLQIDPQFVWR